MKQKILKVHKIKNIYARVPELGQSFKKGLDGQDLRPIYFPHCNNKKTMLRNPVA